MILPNCFGAFAIELQLYGPAFVAVIGVRFGHAITAQVGLFLHEQTFSRRFLVISSASVFVSSRFCIPAESPLCHRRSPQSLAVIGINQAEFELGYTRKLIARLLDLRGIEPWNLNQNSVLTDRADDRFAAAEIIDAFADDFDGLVEQTRSDRFPCRLAGA